MDRGGGPAEGQESGEDGAERPSPVRGDVVRSLEKNFCVPEKEEPPP
jgi:hypothetical protein